MACPFDTRSLIQRFVRDNSNIPALEFISEDPEGIQIDDLVGHGIVNYVFRVSSKDKRRSVIIKYGEEQMRMVPAEKVSLDRQVLEYDCLELLHAIYPGSVPEPFCLDRRHNAIAMQDMKGWDLLETQLQREEVDLEAAAFLGEQLASIHKSTTRQAVGEERWQDMMAKFSQYESKHYLGNMMYARIFDEKDDINIIPEVCMDRYRTYCRTIKQMGLDRKMTTMFEVNECFIHADCHWKAIFVKDGCTVLFDFEFAYLSHPAPNLAFPATAYLVYYILQKVAQPVSKTDLQDFKMKLQQGTRQLVEGYLKASPHLTGSRRSTFLSDLALFIGGTLFMFSVFAFLHVFSKATPEERAPMMETAYKLLISHDKVETVDQLLSTMFDD